ncbi:MCE family protein [Nocardioides sp. R-C-SC26]|uniref:MCE family protein n=1 Tax=Nocardioides sp. R-C-SC26 TaxID=2870414 RepID=UPI001E2CAA11|nr:MCE family protein [Nocardioides sp. R-C-SC26]
MRERTPRRRAVLGLAASLSGLVALTTACIPGGDDRTVTVYFSDSAGLFVGNDVGVLGVPIGAVTAIEPEGAQVKVTLRLDDDQPLPEDVGAVVVARSVATDRYVELTPAYESGPELGDDAVIPVERTRTPVDFDEVLAAINTFATGVAGSQETTDAIRRIIDAGEGALAGRGQLAHDAITDLAGAVGDVSDNREEISGTIVAVGDLVGVLAQNRDTVSEFVRQVSSASDLLADERENFRAALRGLEKAVQTVAEFALNHRRDIDEVIDSSTAVLDTMLDKEERLTEILRVFPLALQNLALAGAGERIPVRVWPSVLLPGGDQIAALCEQLPLNLCRLLSGTEPGDISGDRGGRR